MKREEISRNVKRNKNIKASRKILLRERKKFIDFLGNTDLFIEGLDFFQFAQFPFHYYSTAEGGYKPYNKLTE